MGFYVNLFLLKPNEKDLRRLKEYEGVRASEECKCVLWQAETVLAVGRISSPKDSKPESFTCKSDRARAALYFLSSFFNGFMGHVNTSGRECLAPPFAIASGCHEHVIPYYEWVKHFVTVSGENNWYIDPAFACDPGLRGVMYQSKMEEHNEKRKTCEGYSERHDVIMSFPLVWAPCEMILKWIEEGREHANQFAHRKEDDLPALLHVEMWEACLKQAAKGGFRALFIFNPLHLPDLI